jgi:hypothetical protein
MGIYRRKNVWWITYHDQYRRRIHESSHNTIRRDAERLHALRRSEVLQRVYRAPVRISLEKFAERYLEYAKTNKRSRLRDEQLLKPLKEFFHVERQLVDITPPEIEGHKLWRRRQVSGATVNRERALLKHMFNLAINWDLYIGSNPLPKGEVLSGGQRRFSSSAPGRGNQAVRERHARDSGHCSFCPDYRVPHWRDFVTPVTERGLQQRLDQPVLPENAETPRHPIECRGAANSGVLETGAEG